MLLAVLGVRMILAATNASDEDDKTKPTKHGFWLLAITGFATSIDAMVVGVGLAFLDANILQIALAIGLATFTYRHRTNTPHFHRFNIPQFDL